jgi:hypothetical protein
MLKVNLNEKKIIIELNRFWSLLILISSIIVIVILLQYLTILEPLFRWYNTTNYYSDYYWDFYSFRPFTLFIIVLITNCGIILAGFLVKNIRD